MKSAQALEVFERRVRPIYDALDSRNYKNALKLCDALLEKYKDNPLVLSLRALALSRAGRKDEAGKVCDVLLTSAAPLDDHAMSILRRVLQALQRQSDIVRMCELRHKQDPHDMEIIVALFHAYAREWRFVQQQQVAMKLLKESRGQERYQWWIILSLIMQVRQSLLQQPGHQQAAGAPSSSVTNPTPQLLLLAESMAARQAGKINILESFEALLIWLDLLLARGQPKAALDAFQGPVGTNVIVQGNERAMLHADLLALNGDLQGAAAILATQLRDNPDNWAALLGYLDCLLPSTAAEPVLHTSYLLWLEGGLAQRLAASVRPPGAPPGLITLPAEEGKTQEPQRAEEAAMEAQAMVDELCELAGPLSSDSPQGTTQPRRLCMRGPYLAKVELAARRALLQHQARAQQHEPSPQGNGNAAASNDKKDLGSDSQPIAEAMLAYVGVAGHLASCAADLRTYTRLLGPTQAQWLADQLEAQGLLSPAGLEGLSLKDARRRVCAHQLCADLQLPVLDSPAAALQHALRLISMYQAVQPMYKELDEREQGIADELPTLAAETLIDAAMGQQDTAQVVHLVALALMALEAAVATRPYATGMRLALIALHTLLGSPARAAAHQAALEIKNIQLDSVSSHYGLPALLAYHTGSPAASGAGGKAGVLAGVLAPQGEKLFGAAGLLRGTLALFSDHERDAGETLDTAYQQGTYTKVLEFVSFKERLESSHTRALARSESILIALRNAAYAPSGASSNSAASGTGPAGSGLGSVCAAALTVHPLPWDQLPSLSGSIGLRFNADLATRPAWYPPAAGPACMAPSEWWQTRMQHAGRARGQCAWWCSPQAAEAATPAAQALREAQAGTIRARWCAVHGLTHVLGALKACDTSAVPGLAPDLSSTLDHLGTSLGRPEGTPLDTWLQAQQSSPPHGSDSNPNLQIACCAVLSAGAAAAASLSSASEMSVAVVGERMELAVGLLQQACAGLCDGLGAAAQHTPLPGSLLATATTILMEPMAWLLAILEAALKSSRPTKTKKTAAATSDSGPSASQSLSGVISGGAKGLAQLLEQLQSALTTAQQHLAAQAEGKGGKLMVAVECFQGAQAGGLWEWQQGGAFEPQSVLVQVAASQKEIVTQLRACAASGQGRCQTIAGTL